MQLTPTLWPCRKKIQRLDQHRVQRQKARLTDSADNDSEESEDAKDAAANDWEESEDAKEVIVPDSESDSELADAPTSSSSSKSVAHAGCAKEGALSTGDNQGVGDSTSAGLAPWHREGSKYIGKRVLWPVEGCVKNCPSTECPGHCGTVWGWLPADKADFKNEAGEVRYEATASLVVVARASLTHLPRWAACRSVESGVRPVCRLPRVRLGG
eukprot:3557918-Rhodomonas_salina.1